MHEAPVNGLNHNTGHPVNGKFLVFMKQGQSMRDDTCSSNKLLYKLSNRKPPSEMSIHEFPLTDAVCFHRIEKGGPTCITGGIKGVKILHAASSQRLFIGKRTEMDATYGGRRNSPRLLWRNATPA